MAEKIVIDAGHGAPDGGSTGISGTREDAVNLLVAQRLETLLTLMGYETAMTRTGPDCIATEGDTIRQKKQSDLRNRVELVNAPPAAVAVSIHQNHFPDPRYSGTQVFYSDGGEALAASAQRALTAALAPGSKREPKQAAGVYLMEHIRHPGILVECGFLSNVTEYDNSLLYPINLTITATNGNVTLNTVKLGETMEIVGRLLYNDTYPVKYAVMDDTLIYYHILPILSIC